MKKLGLILMATLALVMARSSNRFSAPGTASAAPLPPLSGPLTNYATTSRGYITLCYKPDFSALESCTASDAVPIEYIVANTGTLITDSYGNSCGTSYGGNYVPYDEFPSPPEVQYSVVKTIDYSSATQTGDSSFTTYVGDGNCNGTSFVNRGATVINTGTSHFVNSSSGRSDAIVTSFTNVPAGSNGSYLLTTTALPQ